MDIGCMHVISVEAESGYRLQIAVDVATVSPLVRANQRWLGNLTGKWEGGRERGRGVGGGRGGREGEEEGGVVRRMKGRGLVLVGGLP